MLKVKYLYAMSLLFLSLSLRAQELLLAGSPIYLKNTGNLPEDLLTTKTTVIVDVGNSGLNWKEVSEQAHTQLKRTGIDAIAYFRWDKFFSGYESQNEIADFLTQRQVRNLILIHAKRESAEVWLTNFNSAWSIMDGIQESWYSRDSTIYKALLPLYQKAALQLERKNLLISDSPEYYEDIIFYDMEIKDSYPPNVKGFKTCVALMPEAKEPEDMREGLKRAYGLYAEALKSRNNTIQDQISTQYPFKFDYIEYGLPMDEIRSDKGCNFYLGYIYGAAHEVQEMFNKRGNNSREVTLNSVLSDKPIIRNISSSRSTFKFYLRNTVTGEIFIGSGWDADVTIEDALINFIYYMKRDLKVNP